MARPKPLLLVILDGFGISTEKEGNPVVQARTPTLDELERFYPFTTLQASGVAVGLPWGEAGNSEVGHLTMGAGRVIYHHLPRIINAVSDGSFFKNEAFVKAAEHVRKHQSRLHIAGLVSSGSVHSYIDHLFALFELTHREGIPEVLLHIFTDGKDAPPTEGAAFLQRLGERVRKEWPEVRFASVIGRSFALDRDEEWSRIQTTYELLTQGRGTSIHSVPAYLSAAYGEGFSDDGIKPAVVVSEGGMAVGIIREHDALIFSDFREDSMRELTRAFVADPFDYFPRKKIPGLLVVTMTEYEKGSPALAAFPTLDIQWPLGRVLSEAGLTQLRVAETQKYAHVTYFFNGGVEKPFPGEERILIPSLPTAHFEEVPAMRTPEITERILEEISRHDVAIANFANADMVGHSGSFAAAIEAVEVIDQALAKLHDAVGAGSGIMVVTADHGNIELKRNVISGEKLTEHSTNPVPFFLAGKAFRRKNARSASAVAEARKTVGGILTDVAPTLLELLEMKKPAEMSGESLLDTLTGR